MIVVSVLERELSALRAQALAQVPHADMIELRLDCVGDPGTDQLLELVRAIAKPVIAAVNGPDAHGFFRGGRDERFAILAAAVRAGVAYVDVDWRDARLQAPLPAACRRIVSRHAMDDIEEPERAWSELAASARPNDVLKLVVNARRAEDGVRMLESVRAQERAVVGFAGGAPCSFTRVLAPVFGSAWTYAAPALVAGTPAGEPSAPGQLRADELRAQWPAAGITRGTRVFAVLGRPVAQSLSPALHGAALRARRTDALYLAIEPDDLRVFVARCQAPQWAGFSITAPFKSDALACAARADEPARHAHAANTLVREPDGSWSAYNTDVPAVASTVRGALERAQKDLAGARILVVGTGGAARAALLALQGAELTVAGRDPAERAELAHEFRCEARALDDVASPRWDVIVQCTPLGSRAHPGQSAVDVRALQAGTIVLDAVYRPERTPLRIEAERAGAVPIRGAEWFVRQAALQVELFTRKPADEAVLRAVFERALHEDLGT